MRHFSFLTPELRPRAKVSEILDLKGVLEVKTPE